MIKVESIDTWGFDHAIRGMRNPMNSWEKSDSEFCTDPSCQCPRMGKMGCDGAPGDVALGENDLRLMRSLYKAGPDHRKFMRQIFVSMDITAPLYWWKEFDTYKVGTAANSCGTMHKLTSKPLEASDFSFEKIGSADGEELISDVLDGLNNLIDIYTNFSEYEAAGKLIKGLKREDVWYALIQLLPESYNQKRTVTFNYEVAASMINQRTGHRLDEWKQFVDILRWDLPWLGDIMD